MQFPHEASTCPDEDVLCELVEGRLPADALASVEEHVGSCADCAALIAHLSVSRTGTSDALGALRDLSPVDIDRYEVRREIAHGGMGAIWEALDRRHGRAVAIKVLRRHDDVGVSRFVRETRITARLQHPTIIPLYEAGRWSDGEPFFAMKLVEGRSLAEVVAERRSLASRMTLLPHLIAVADALAYAHARGVIHRDLKPSNVLIGAFGETVVIDWGLAKELGGDTDEPDLGPYRSQGETGDVTVAGRALGTPSYMPREQALGEAVDARADVYALGAMLYHVLSGAPPYTGSSSR